MRFSFENERYPVQFETIIDKYIQREQEQTELKRLRQIQ
jgi:hypothetical protein